MKFIFSIFELFVMRLVVLSFLNYFEYISAENHAIFYVNRCEENHFYDTTSLLCRPCGAADSEQREAQRTSPDGLSCICRFGYRFEEYTSSGLIMCKPCAAQNELASTCASCEFRSESSNSSDICGSCEKDQITVVRHVDGALFSEENCVSCKPGTHLSSSNESDMCVPCLEHLHRTGLKTCDCPERTHAMLGGVCFKISDLKGIPETASLYTIRHDYQELESSFFCHRVGAAIALCQRYGNATACQLLANLCVLSMYHHDGDVQNACTQYLRLATVYGENIASGGLNTPQQANRQLPWLYYQFESVEETTKKKDVEATYSFKRRNSNSRLNLTAATYSADGQFINLGPISAISMQLCGGAFGILDRAFNYGTRYSRKCRIPVRDLFNRPETVFFDPYVFYEVPGKAPVLYAIPVLIRNYMENGQLFNRGSSAHWKFVRRFFIVDNVSGRTPCLSPSILPAVVKYAKDITIRIEMYRSSNEASHIYPPLIIIDYSEATLEDFNADNDVEVSFSVTYEMDREKEDKDYSISIGVLTGVGVMYSAIQTWSWSKRSGRLAVDFLALIKFLLFCCGNLSNIFFIVTFVTCFYILVFFKMQDVVYVVLPAPHQETLFIVMMIVAFFLKTIHLIHVLVLQVLVDIFFVDWERPRPKRTIPHPCDVSSSDDDSVSIWRTYLVANEWAELQTTRKTSIGLQLFSTVFLLTVAGLENLASSDPSANVSDSQFEYRSPDSIVCRMALAITVYLTVAVVQYFFITYIYERLVEDKIRQFIDLCSISNVSVFLMTHRQFGHYIHGRSVHGHADTGMKSMHEQLRREEDNLCSQRGLLANSDQQTFHIALPVKLRSYYDHVMAPLIQGNQLPGRISAATASPTRNSAGTNMLSSSDCSIQAYQTMNKFLASFLEHVLRDLDYIVKDRLFVENLLDIEFQDPTDKGFFYIDNGHSYDAALLCGQEVTLVLFDMLLFVCVDLASRNFVLSAVVTFVVSKVIVFIYRAVSHRNLAQKTLVDSRFLI